MCKHGSVLIVEDEPEIARMVGIRLRSVGYRTLTAGDGMEGVSSAIEKRPDAIVMDVRMPRKDGLTALSELRTHAITRNIPVVMLSASLVDQPAALDAGARFFLKKPYEPKTLLAAVDKAITENIRSRN